MKRKTAANRKALARRKPKAELSASQGLDMVRAPHVPAPWAPGYGPLPPPEQSDWGPEAEPSAWTRFWRRMF